MELKNALTNLTTTQNKTVNEHSTVQYRSLYRLIDGCQSDRNLLSKAIRLIQEAYQASSQTPDILAHTNKLIEIALIVATKFYLPAHAIVATILKDTIKDQKISSERIKQQFNEPIADMVMQLTHLSQETTVFNTKNTDQQGISFHAILANFSINNLFVVLIKLAEYLYNMRKFDEFTTDIQAKIIDAVESIYIPLAHRLGLSSVQAELEDLQLKFQHKAIYDTITHQVRSTKATDVNFLSRFITPIHEKLQKEIPHYSIKARTKSIASIWHKIEARNISFEDINDLYAIRIVFDSERAHEHSNCWLIYELITSLYDPRLDRLRDWVTYPKDSGYEALHITVITPEKQWVEIQIRTSRMDKEAEHGDAAHWKYKARGVLQSLSHVETNWLEAAKKFLVYQSEKYKQKHTLDINIDELYIKV